jgi:hypothetical protein
MINHKPYIKYHEIINKLAKEETETHPHLKYLKISNLKRLTGGGVKKMDSIEIRSSYTQEGVKKISNFFEILIWSASLNSRVGIKGGFFLPGRNSGVWEEKKIKFVPMLY